jgi:serine/threonine protein kinase
VIVDHPALIAGRYRVDQPLGAGGMGTVYAGHDLRLDRDVAVKVLRDDLTRDPSLRHRFEREARAAARVTHPHAVAVYDTGEDAECDVFIVMERLTGRTLGHEIADGRVDEARLRQVADAVLGALGAAHAEGIVHRDVKPGNILLADDGTLKIGDFGIASFLDAGDTTTRVPMGTPAYTAPERLRGLSATERSDLYSLGVVLYEAAAGVRPFTGEGATAVAEAVVAGTHVPLDEQRPDLSPVLVAVIERALANDPADRFADAEQMLAALDAPALPPTTPVAVTVPIGEAAGATATLPPPSRVRPAPMSVPAPAPTPAPNRVPTSRRFDGRRAVLAGLVVLVMALAVVVGVLLTRGDDSATSTAPTTQSPSTTVVAPVAGPSLPAPLARALDRLEEATQP